MSVIHRGGGKYENLDTEGIALGVQIPYLPTTEVYNWFKTWSLAYLEAAIPFWPIKQWKFNPNEKFFTSRTTRLEWRDVRKMSSIRGRSVTVRLASAIAAEGILDDSKPLGSGRPFRYFRSAIVEVQAHVRTVILYVANYSLAQFFVGLIFVGNARPRKLNLYEKIKLVREN